MIQAISLLLSLHLNSLTIGLVNTIRALGYSDLVDLLGLHGLREQ